MIVVTFGGLRSLLGLAMQQPGGLEINLFVNDHRPNIADLPGSYVVPGFAGYAGQPLRALSVPYIAGGGAEVSEAVHRWTVLRPAAPPDRIYGYVVVRVRDGAVLWAERTEDAGFLMAAPGQRYSVLPRIRALNLVV